MPLYEYLCARCGRFEIIQKFSQLVPAGGENAAFHLTRPQGLRPGTYKAIVFLGNDSVDTKVFVVKK